MVAVVGGVGGVCRNRWLVGWLVAGGRDGDASFGSDRKVRNRKEREKGEDASSEVSI